MRQVLIKMVKTESREIGHTASGPSPLEGWALYEGFMGSVRFRLTRYTKSNI